MAPSSCFVQLHSHLAGHCPNTSSLNPPLAAVVVVAPKGGADKKIIILCNIPSRSFVSHLNSV
ncbi:hypothetical protein DW816_09750 [Faecalibacterium prausnitzii]|nr:hypothetical protein DW816_09750 [Faecalibacterium prausnitzii]